MLGCLYGYCELGGSSLSSPVVPNPTWGSQPLGSIPLCIGAEGTRTAEPLLAKYIRLSGALHYMGSAFLLFAPPTLGFVYSYGELAKCSAN